MVDTLAPNYETIELTADRSLVKERIAVVAKFDTDFMAKCTI
jgi:hypothetical protein